MPDKFNFTDLFTFDLANNHQGDVEHGLNIIRATAAVAHENGIRAALKFQFRDLDTMIHPSHRSGTTNKHIPRFLSTRLSREQFVTLTEEVRKQNLVTMSTPFDEASVDMLLDLGIEVIKIASCSANDWPLLEKVADANSPVVASTGGLTMKEIDNLVSFFDHRRVHFALMHCVSIYPTPDEQMELNQITALRERYRHIPIGFSTHEDPNDTSAVQVAVAKGAQLFERHVGLATARYKLNAYSSTPEQLDKWIRAFKKARALCGAAERPPAPPEEVASLQSLKRGIYAREPIEAGAEITRDQVFFAMPVLDGQLHSGQWRLGMTARHTISANEPLRTSSLNIPQNPRQQVLYHAIHLMKGMLNEARISLPADFEVEFSHHYGVERFKEVGATFVTIVNRSYCKKLVIQLAGQRHPSHFHKRKEETFLVLHGTLEMEIANRRRTLIPGDTILIQQGVWHAFWTDTGVIFEEISTTNFNDDSFYEDKSINHMQRSERKTVVNHWGQFQI